MKFCIYGFKLLLLHVAVIAFFVLMPHSDAVVFVLTPDGPSASNWTGNANDINEGIRNDNNFIQSKLLKQGQTDRVSFSLSDGDDPIINEGHIIRYAFKEDGVGNNSPYLIVRLKQGATTIESWTESSPLPTTFTQKEYLVSPQAIGQITDYHDLIVEFEAICEPSICTNDNADRDTVSVSWMQLQYESTTTPRDHALPKIKGIGFYNITNTGTEILTENYVEKWSQYDKSLIDSKNVKYMSGTFFDSNENIPTFSGLVNKPIHLQIQLEGIYSSTKIEHLSIISGIKKTRSEFVPVNFEVIVDKGKKSIIVDPNKIFKSVNATYSLRDGYFWADIDLIFQKPVKKSSIVIQIWDEQRLPVYLEIPDAWEISDSSLIQIQKEVPRRTVIGIIEGASLSNCNAVSCFEPTKLQIRKGGIVTWVNDDTVLHTVISGDPQNGPDGKFNFAMIPGKIYEKIFDNVGTYKYYCSLHPWNTGVIEVSENISMVTEDKHPFLTVVFKSFGKITTNNQKITLENNDLNVIITGNIPNIKKLTPITLVIKKPDQSTETFTTSTNRYGTYHTPVLLSKKWQSGEYYVFLIHQKQEISNLSFIISSKN